MFKPLFYIVIVVVTASCGSSKEAISSGAENQPAGNNTVRKPAAVSVSAPSPENSPASADAPAKPVDRKSN